ncbi:MAG: carbohydrate kinase family protein [Planctomycetota bacterium]
MPANEVVVAGHICLDLTPKFPDTGVRSLSDILVPGSLVVVDECVVSTGGPVANTGLALRKLGVDCLLMGKVGEDAFGDLVAARLEEYDCAAGIVRIGGEQTAYTVVIAPPGIDRLFLHNPGANNSFSGDDIDYAAVEQTRVFHLGYPPLLRRLYEDGGRELVSIFRRAREAGATTSLDMSLPDPESASGSVDWDAILRKVLPYTDLFLPSAEEVLYCLEPEKFRHLRAQAAEANTGLLDVLTPEDYSPLGRRLVEYGAGVAALKSGHRGIYVRTADRERLDDFGRAPVGDTDNWADREVWEPAYRVENVASATGAGDSAIAGFLAAFLRGQTIEGTLRYATAVGARNVMRHDAISGLLGYHETTEMLSAMPKAELDFRETDWQYDAERRLWHGPNA